MRIEELLIKLDSIQLFQVFAVWTRIIIALIIHLRSVKIQDG